MYYIDVEIMYTRESNLGYPGHVPFSASRG